VCTTALIEKMPEVLTWSGHAATFEQVHDNYRQGMSDALGNLFAAIDRVEPALGRQLLDELQEASDAALLRVVLAPQTSHRLLWEQPQRLRDTADFFLRSLLAEKAKEGRPAALAEETWTALGDALVLPTGEVVTGPSIEGLMPLDLDSPQVWNADPLGLCHARPLWYPLTGYLRELALHRLALAQRAIAATSIVVSAFTTLFIKVLVLQKDDEESSFTAYSAQQYPGRTVIGNPQHQLVDVVHIAEAIVHEAIHALLYMLLQTHPWGIEDPLYDDKPKVVSPWTGTRLPVSTFLHACFVWYGLLHFWSLALGTTAFPLKRTHGRMSRAALGFLGSPLLELVDEADRVLVAAPVQMAIQRMQARVMEALASDAPGGATAINKRTV
jgi:hypothetical protein